MDLINKKYRQSNTFVDAPYSTEFTTHEIKLIEYMISSCKDVDKHLINAKSHKEFTFSATDLAKILHTSLSRIVLDADKLSDNITSKKIIEKKLDSNGNVTDFVYIPIISFAGYNKGMFTFSFNYYILKYFIEINKNFTEFQLKYLLIMKSAYAIKLYKLLYQYKNIKSRVFSLLELKEQFGIQDKYPKYNDFKRRIVDPSVEQINQLTDLNIEYKEIKICRSIEKIEFNFKLKNQISNLDCSNENTQTMEIRTLSTIDNSTLPELDKLLLGIESELSEKTKKLVVKVYKDKGIEYIEASIKYATKNSKSNFDVYLYNTISKGWAEVELQKTLDKKAELKKQRELAKYKKQEESAKLQAKKQHKLTIESEWSNLTEEQQELYNQHAVNLINKYSKKLEMFPTINNDLPICCYAVSQNKSYDTSIEGYCKMILQIELNTLYN